MKQASIDVHGPAFDLANLVLDAYEFHLGLCGVGSFPADKDD
jgi:hypothetical protein